MIRIKDIAEELGVSTATVSNVIHKKTNKVSKKTVERVEEILKRENYVPNMAAVLLSKNSSKFICVIISNHVKYEHKLLQDPFVAGIINELSVEIDKLGYHMMIKVTQDIEEIVGYVSMWNMAGMVLLGFNKWDYQNIKKRTEIPFVVIDGFITADNDFSTVSIDDYNGGYQIGSHVAKMGHKKVAFLADNDVLGDQQRFYGFRQAMHENGIIDDGSMHIIISSFEKERMDFYENLISNLEYTCLSFSSDLYAIEAMNFIIDHGLSVPKDVSITGFDDIYLSTIVRPRLTTIRQDVSEKAKEAVDILDEYITGVNSKEEVIKLPVELVVRDSVKNLLSK